MQEYSFSKYANPDGSYDISYNSPDGKTYDLHHPDVESVFEDKLHLCGCGDEFAPLEYVHNILKGYRDKTKGHPENFFKSPGELYFVLHMMEYLGLLEHGTSVHGSYLTEEGKVMLTDLDIYIQSQNS